MQTAALGQQGLWMRKGKDVVYTNRFVGIGTPSPESTLEVAGDVKAEAFIGDGSQLTNTSNWWADEDNNILFDKKGGSVAIGHFVDDQIEKYELQVAGAVKAEFFLGDFIGDGSRLTNIPFTSNWTKSENSIHYTQGDVGIGTTSPSARLDVNGTLKANRIRVDGSNIDFIKPDAPGGYARGITFRTDEEFGFPEHFRLGILGNNPEDYISHFYMAFGESPWSSGKGIYIKPDGKVSIGTTNPRGYKLAVAGDIIAEEVVVKLHGDWPDYVFHDDYNLRTIPEVEAFIEKHGHLPDVPSAKAVEEKNIALGEMNTILLKKVEELTLYIIEQNKRIEKLEKMARE